MNDNGRFVFRIQKRIIFSQIEILSITQSFKILGYFYNIKFKFISANILSKFMEIIESVYVSIRFSMLTESVIKVLSATNVKNIGFINERESVNTSFTSKLLKESTNRQLVF